MDKARRPLIYPLRNEASRKERFAFRFPVIEDLFSEGFKNGWRTALLEQRWLLDPNPGKPRSSPRLLVPYGRCVVRMLCNTPMC